MKRISSFEQRIKFYRKKYNLTLDELSQKINLPSQTINRYELGQRVPKIDVAIEIAEK